MRDRRSRPGAQRSGDFFLRPGRGVPLGAALSASVLLHAAAFSIDLPATPGARPLRPPGLEARLRPVAEERRPADDIGGQGEETAPANRTAEKRSDRRTDDPEDAAAVAAPAEAFVDARQLDVRPAIRTRTMPAYPATLPPGASGTVVLELLIARTGRVAAVEVVTGSGFQEMDAAAVAAFMAAEFDPGRAGGVPVAAKIRISVSFDGE